MGVLPSHLGMLQYPGCLPESGLSAQITFIASAVPSGPGLTNAKAASADRIPISSKPQKNSSKLETDIRMSTITSLFNDLCHGLTSFYKLSAAERRLAAIRDAGKALEDQAIALAAILAARDKHEIALNFAMRSHSLALVLSMPEAPYDTYKMKSENNIRHWATDVDPDMILALTSRGLSMEPALNALLTRGFRQKDQRLRDWALRDLAPNPGDFKWVHSLTGHNIGRNPVFAAALLNAAVQADPEAARACLETAVDWRDGICTVLLLHAGVTLPDGMDKRFVDRLQSLSSHARLSVMRNSISAFAADKHAVRAARLLLKD